ncbi:transcriptional regulator [Catenulispora rubra]|uniref:transcriptional regulator n=1 Tax=Catenulispora rubra TaxID=280293 RepID=UPI0018927F51|nr:transcriptional regulator [Catenulispora rubra]
MGERASTPTLTGGQGSDRLPRQSLISGYVLRLARESVPERCSQERLAQAAGVSPDTEAGWETGRRPLAAIKTAQFVALKATLIRLGAAPELVRLMEVALEADQLLDHARVVADHHEPASFHPLGAYVHRREVVELVAWPLSCRTPTAIAAVSSSSRQRRGPVPTGPELAVPERAQVFDHLRRVAEASRGSDTAGLLHRQALYLQSYDRRPDAGAWMAEQYRLLPRQRSGWSPQWPAARTLAASLVRYGNAGTLIDFSHYGLADEAGHIANLNYWAYWVGELSLIERDDSFMPIKLDGWHGERILRHLATRLDAEEGVADLGIHTLRTLLAARPQLLDDDRVLTATLSATAEHLLEAGKMSPNARQALAEVHYALRLHNR